jgi:hypothetical protein
MKGRTFGTAINCMDGRVQLPVTAWMKETFKLDYVDKITEPGADKLVALGETHQVEPIKAKVQISCRAHGSTVVALAGHDDCAGNPCSKEEHLSQIRRGAQVIRSWGLPVTIVGLWVNDRWQVEPVDL